MSCYFNYAEEPQRLTRDRSKEASLSREVSNWIVEAIQSKLESKDAHTDDLSNFKSAVEHHILSSFSAIHCANLRTTSPDSNLLKLANECGIPAECLPSNISIVVTSKSAFYFPSGSKLRTMIVA